eukprot:Clim_evm43s207 gene=Clim_evmTU43s207
MVLDTVIARVTDGLPLVATMESSGHKEHKHQAKMLLKKLNESQSQRMTIDTDGGCCFHYMIEKNVCYMVLCEQQYPKKLAFKYLEDLQQEFERQYQDEVETVARPYAFINFDTYIQRLKKSYGDTRSAKNMQRLNDELQDVQRIMSQNIQDVLDRGERIEKVSEMASSLSIESKKYLKDSKYLAWMELIYKKYGPIILFVVVVLGVLYLRFYIFSY